MPDSEWMAIAQQLIVETDPHKITKLCAELLEALERRSATLHERVKFPTISPPPGD
jgi:hypothetical protein